MIGQVTKRISNPTLAGAGDSLSPLEEAVVELFVGILRLLGLPKSLGEVYGLLFIAAEPLSLDDLAHRLRLSRGSVTQGLKTLRQIGAVRLSPTLVGRRDLYVAETEFKRVAVGFLSSQILPSLAAGEEFLARLRELAEKEEGMRSPENAAARADRVSKLEQWHRRASALAPMLGKFLD